MVPSHVDNRRSDTLSGLNDLRGILDKIYTYLLFIVCSNDPLSDQYWQCLCFHVESAGKLQVELKVILFNTYSGQNELTDQ